MQSSLSGFFRACIVGALVLLQFAIIIIIPLLFRDYATQFYILIEISGMIGIQRAFSDHEGICISSEASSDEK